MSEPDTTRIQNLGRKYKRLAAQTEQLLAEMDPEIFNLVQAGVSPTRLAEWTGLARESIRVKGMTPEQREAERQKRTEEARRRKAAAQR